MKKEEVLENHYYFACINGVWKRIKTSEKPISKKGNVKCYDSFHKLIVLSPDDLVDATNEEIKCIIEKKENEEKEEQERKEKQAIARFLEEIKDRSPEEQREKETVFSFYGINLNVNTTVEEIEDCVFKNLRVPTYAQFKNDIFDYLKTEGIHDTKEHIEDAFNPESGLFDYLYDYDYQPLRNSLSEINKRGFGCYEKSLMNDLEDFFYTIVDDMNHFDYLNYLFIEEFRLPESPFLPDIIGSFMPDEYDDKNPNSLNYDYFDRLEKEDFQELKDLIISLAPEEE